MSRAGRDERGAATLLVVSMAGVLLLVGAALGVVGALMVDHRRAEAAADLAALAGARRLADGGDGCGAAAEVAARNDAALVACRTEAADVVVLVSVAGPQWLGQSRDLLARARAGPASLG